MTHWLFSELRIATKSIFKSILDLLFPNSCQNCCTLIERTELLCTECLNHFKPLASCIIGKDGSKLEVFSRFLYSNKIKFLVQSKYCQDTSLLLKASRLLETCSGLTSKIKSEKVDGWVIIPVPLHWTRQLNRGFNQAQILANGFSKAINCPVINALKRCRKTKFQASTKTKAERLANVSNAFALNILPIIGKSKKKLIEQTKSKGIILVDDLLTSGSTLLECAKVIKKELNPKVLIAVTLCRS